MGSLKNFKRPRKSEKDRSSELSAVMTAEVLKNLIHIEILIWDFKLNEAEWMLAFKFERLVG